MKDAFTRLVAAIIPGKKLDADRVGVFLSVLCAIHCAATPFLLIFLPTFGKIWSHPASHWGMALFVVPIAIAMLMTGYRRHQRKWIIATGSIGIVLIIIGSILPYIETSKTAAVAMEEAEEVYIYVAGEADSELEEDDEPYVYNVAEDPDPMTTTTGCTDNCCPSLVTDADGNTRLNIPPASIVTTLGGLSLIITHVGNLCSCPCCPGGRRRRRKAIA